MGRERELFVIVLFRMLSSTPQGVTKKVLFTRCCCREPLLTWFRTESTAAYTGFVCLRLDVTSPCSFPCSTIVRGGR